MGLYKRNKVWWMSLNVQGKQIRRTTETSDRKLAEAIYSKVHVRLIEGKYFDHGEETERTVAELLDRYEREHIPKKASQRTLRGYLKNVRPFFGQDTLAELTPKVIVQYKAKRYQDGVKPATINRELALMKHAFNLAIKEWEWAKQNPVSRVSFEQEDNKRDRWLRQEEEARLLPACPLWVRGDCDHGLTHRDAHGRNSLPQVEHGRSVPTDRDDSPFQKRRQADDSPQWEHVYSVEE